MKQIRRIGFVVLIVCYLVFFSLQEKNASTRIDALSKPLPYAFQKTATGYLSQLWAAVQYARLSVFLGNATSHQLLKANERNIADTFLLISRLHPKLKDTYYFTQGHLASISPDSARNANQILQNGIRALPDDWTFEFFSAFNHFHYLDEPVKAADILINMVQEHPDAPDWLGHLAGVLLAQGGDIRSGLFMLELMATSEQDPMVKERYQSSIAVYKKAIQVLEAIERFERFNGFPPHRLDHLVPEFIDPIPDLGDQFSLQWVPPVLSLIRSERKEHPDLFPKTQHGKD
ncbi:MAG: hypothetical protein MI862_19470 [Desulfobacterales bacterium]|nr:hypothetical protein [Desulfobacterales bacterium]